MAIGKCIKCDKIEVMTEDHVFPKWLRSALPNFGVKPPAISEIHLMCQACNSKKGGNLDWTDITTRMIMKEIVTKFIAEIRKHEEFNP